MKSFPFTRRHWSLAILSAFVIGHSSFRCNAADWPQFRGPDGTGASSDAKVPDKLRIQWTAPLPGRGLSSAIIVGDKVFITCASGPKQERLHVMCLNEADGKKIWERQLKATGRTMSHPKTCVASSTPCSDGKRIFAQWSSNDLAAFDLEGNLLWLRGLTADYANASNSLGMASSPVVAGDSLIVQIENDSESYALGIDPATGRNLWKMERPKAANWTSATVWRPEGRTSAVAVLQSSKGLTGVDAHTGSRLWDYADGAATMASSVVTKNAIYAVSHGITALQPGNEGGEPKQLWRAEQVNPGTASPVVLGEKLYALNGAGVLVSADLKNGERGWKLRLNGPFSASPVGAGDRVVAVSETGFVQVVDVTAAEGAVVGKLELKDEMNKEAKELILATPSLHGAHIYVRSDSKLWRLGE